MLPVIFWIHGGAFYAGDGGIEENGPEFLMDQNIIIVTINYRLGPFGKEIAVLRLNLQGFSAFQDS